MVEESVEVVVSRACEIDGGQGYSPAKPKAKRIMLGIGLVWRPFVWTTLKTYGVR